MDKLIEQLDLYFGKKAPQLPKSVKEFLVKISPYLAIIGVVLFVISIFPLLAAGLGSLGAVGYYGAGLSRTSLFVHLIVSVIVSVIYVGLALWTRRKPVLSLLIALLLYISLVSANYILVPGIFINAWKWQLLVVFAFGYGLFDAIRFEKLRRK